MWKLIVAAAVGIVLTPSPGLAYLSPDQGSIFLQLLLGGLAGVGVVVKLYWHRLRAFLTRRPPDDRH